jgi:hypothetical protein
VRQRAEPLSPECLQCIALWVTPETDEFSEKFLRAFMVAADLAFCSQLVVWSQFDVMIVLGAMVELEVISQHEI